MSSQGVILLADNNTKETTEKPSEEVKISCYEETIWDDFYDKEVDEIYGKIYRQLR